MQLVHSRGGGEFPGHTHQPNTPSRTALWLGGILSVGLGASSVVLERFADGGGPSLLPVLLRDSVLALPLMVTAVRIALRLADRSFDRRGSRLERAATGALVGLMSAAVFALGEPVHDLFFDPAATGVSPPLDALRSFLAALPVALPLATLGTALGGRASKTEPLRAAARLVSVALAAALIASGFGVLGSSAAAQSTPAPSSPCPEGAPVRNFDVTAIDVAITIDRFGDRDPGGKMYVLTNQIPAVRAQEQSRDVTTGQRDDPIQPLAIRANLGDCVEIRFTNQASGGDYGLHIDGLVYNVDSSGDAIGANPASTVSHGASRTYRFWVPEDPTVEGPHYIHPGPGNRDAVNHGLFGALIAEPPGSVYLHPERDEILESGWEARIVPGADRAFREYSLIFHEIGNEDFRLQDASGGDVDVVDPITDAYRPGSRAINYRSEPFMRRLEREETGESQGYGTYMFGDPATPVPRAYVGDPTKIRLLHGGGEVFHVFHLHGGGDRWRQNPHADPSYDYAQTGLDKQPVTKKSASARLDSQSMGPGEGFDLQIEGGAGGVQQAVGDFLFHCHIAEHYIGGMWSFWRVYNTLQPDLAPLPDSAPPPEAVDSTELLGLPMPDGTVLNESNLDDWIRPQLPPQGVPHDSFDAQVWDWTLDESSGLPLYLGEPETPQNDDFPNLIEGVPGHKGSYPGDEFVGNRPKIMFDPINGRPAYPLLRPHIGERPPFSPNGHSGAPYLGNDADVDPGPAPNPWAGRADGLCPRSSPDRAYNVVGIHLPIQVSDSEQDPNGKIFVLADDKNAFLNGTKPPEPLAVRANIGDCVELTLVNEVPDEVDFAGFSKLNMHIHHVQFDVQASDGVISGAAFEQSVRPYRVEDPQLIQEARAGDTVLRLTSVAKFHEGTAIGIGLGTNGIEVNKIVAIDQASNTVTLDAPLQRTHAVDQWAGVEFVQYRWYPDVLLDNVFWHDHVDGIRNWGHGLVGQLLVEPEGSTYHDPRTGAETNGAGAISDIYTNDPLIPGQVETSFRELALWSLGNSPATGGAWNLQAEPWSERSGEPSLLFSSYAHGDPRTPLPRAYAGDPFVIRAVGTGPTLDSLHVDGHRFTVETRFRDPAGETATPLSTLRLGVSERFTVALEGGAGGVRQQPGDYLYMSAVARHFRQGAWGIMRVLGGLVTQGADRLVPLPDRGPPSPGPSLPSPTGGPPPASSGPGNPCPGGSASRTFDVTAVEPVGGGGADGRSAVFVESSSAAAVIAGSLVPEPLVLHVAEGDCVTVNFTNRLDERSSFHVDQLVSDPLSSGVNAGFSSEQTVAPGGSRTYRYFADKSKIGVAAISDFGTGEGGGDESDAGLDGRYGAVVVAPEGAEFFDPLSGAPKDTGTQVDVHLPGGTGYRDFTMIAADQDERIGQDDMPYPTEVDGPAFINYRQNPSVREGSVDFTGASATPTLRAYAGDPTRIHMLVAPSSEQYHTFSVGGLSWSADGAIPEAQEISTIGLGPLEDMDANIYGGAGGRGRTVGDFFYGSARKPFVQAGMWGIFRVLSNPACPIRPLPGLDCLGLPSLATGAGPQPSPTDTASPTPTESPTGPSPGPDDGFPVATGGAKPKVISPNGDGKRDRLRLKASFSETLDWTAEVLKRGRVLWADSGSGDSLEQTWDGTSEGRRVRDGTYRWRISGADVDGDQMDTLKGSVRVDTKRPTVKKLVVEPARFDPARGRLRLRFRLGEPAAVTLKLIRGKRVFFRLERVVDEGMQKVRWSGRRNGRPAPAGRYRLFVRATDEGLNRLEMRRAAVVRLRR